MAIDAYIRYLNDKASDNDFYFIQIGAHSGGEVQLDRGAWSPHLVDLLHDYVKRNRWRGLLVEPLPEAFARLQKFYEQQKDRLDFEQVAVYTESGQRLMYVGQYDDLSSLSDERGDPTRETVRTEMVQCVTINELIERYQIKKIDLLQIDTEGFDCQILLDLDLSLVKPAAICFEHRHATGDECEACLKRLAKEGYKVQGSDDFDYFLTCLP